MEPLCSVVIPVYNCERTVEAAVHSALLQDYDNLEVIAVDDCSTDGSYAILQELAQCHANLKVFRNEENMGVAAARNRGIALAQGGYVALLDSDDIWLERKISAQMRFLRENGGRLCYCSYGFIDRDGSPIGRPFLVPERTDFKGLLARNVLSCSTILAERELLIKCPFDASYYHEDFVAWIELLRECGTAQGCTEVLAGIRIMRGTRSGNKLQSARRRWQVYRRYLMLDPAHSLYYFGLYSFYCLKKYRLLAGNL